MQLVNSSINTFTQIVNTTVPRVQNKGKVEPLQYLLF